MKIAMSADHGGFELKDILRDYLTEKGNEITDLGTNTPDSVDYPDYAKLCCDEVAKGNADFGILVCGTGVGISIAANKVRGIRACCCSDKFSAEMTRLHNDANMLAFGARVLGAGTALKIVDTFLDTPFSNDERHMRRIAKIEKGE